MIEPYDFQCKTNIEEHNDIVNKVNEIVSVVNELDVEEITKDISALESEVSAQGNEIDALNTEVAGLPTKTEVANSDITAVAVDKTSAGIEIQLTRPAGVLEDSVALPFINTATLIPTSTDRAFKIRFTYTDGTQYDTNEFVIPEGGGTDVSVTGVTVEDGTAPNSFKVAIQLSDASTIASNDYEIEIPSQQNTYPTSVSGTLSGTTLTLTIGLNNSTNVTGTVDLSAFLTKSEASTTYATKTEVTTVDNKVTAIGVTSEGNNVTVNGSNATIVKSVSGTVTDGNLKITVNGVESGDIPLPESSKPLISINSVMSVTSRNILKSGSFPIELDTEEIGTEHTIVQLTSVTVNKYSKTISEAENDYTGDSTTTVTALVPQIIINTPTYLHRIKEFTISDFDTKTFKVGINVIPTYDSGTYRLYIDKLCVESDANYVASANVNHVTELPYVLVQYDKASSQITILDNSITIPNGMFVVAKNASYTVSRFGIQDICESLMFKNE